jgi:hypothetical protein
MARQSAPTPPLFWIIDQDTEGKLTLAWDIGFVSYSLAHKQAWSMRHESQFHKLEIGHYDWRKGEWASFISIEQGPC